LKNDQEEKTEMKNGREERIARRKKDRTECLENPTFEERVRGQI